MAHSISTENILKNAFLLRHIAHGSKRTCKELHYTRDGEETDDSICYGYRLKEIASELLIESAIKIRIILDSINNEHKSYDISEKFQARFSDSEYRAGCLINERGFADAIHLRETCNKIIHANKVTLNWVAPENENYEYWDGVIGLEGMKDNIEWICKIDINNFCRVLEEYVFEVIQTGDFNYSAKP